MASISSLGIGSGLDLNGLLDQLKAAERQKLQPLAQQKQGYQARISAYGKLEGALSQFQVAVSKIGNADSYQQVKSTVTGTAVTAAAGADAFPGTYAVNVTALAKAYSVATEGVDSKTDDLGAATVKLTLGNGETLEAVVEADASSLEDIRDAINKLDAGVSASIVNDGDPANPYRLVLASTDTGTEGAITNVDFGDLAGTLSLDAGTEIAAQNASLTVNNILVTSQSNRVEDAIQGVTLNLVEEDSATLTVTRDTKAAKDAVTSFVKAYNTLQSTIGDLSSFNAETGEAGILLGDATLRRIQTQLRTVLGGAIGEDDLRMLSDIGAKLQLDGTIQLDEKVLDELVENDISSLSAFLSGGENGLAGRLGVVLEPELKSAGSLDRASDGLEQSIERVDERYAQMERGIEATIARYRIQFGQLDSMIATMNSTSDYLFQQFDMMNAQLNRK